MNVDERRFTPVGDHWETAGYASAKNRVDVVVDTGVSSVRVR